MRNKLFFKSAFRQPLRVLFLFIVTGLIAFMTVSKGAEYFTLKQATESIASYYTPAASLESLGGAPDVDAAEEYIKSNPLVHYLNMRRFVSGMIAEHPFYNDDREGIAATINSHAVTPGDEEADASDFIFYGTLKEFTEDKNGDCDFEFAVDSVLAGWHDFIRPGNNVRLSLITDDVLATERPQTRLRTNVDFKSAASSLTINERYLIRGWHAYDMEEHMTSVYLTPLYQDGEWFIHAPQDVDLQTPEYARLNTEIGLITDNINAFQIITTKNLGITSDFKQEINYIHQGRAIDYTDQIEQRNVCVISEVYAEECGLEIGDVLTIELRDLENENWGWAASKEDIKNYGNYDTITQEYEIVGTWEYNPEYYGQESSIIFIPDSTVPESFHTDVESFDKLNSLQIVLYSVDDCDKFIEQTQDKLYEFGLMAVFDESNYSNFKAMSAPMLQSSLTNTLIYSGLSIIALAIVIFIYFRLRRKDMAITRALGASKGRCAFGAGLPLILLSLISTAVGGIAAWYYTSQNVSDTLSSFKELGIEFEANVNIALPLIIAGAVFAVTALAIIITSRIIVSKPVLELLQGGKRNK